MNRRTSRKPLRNRAMGKGKVRTHRKQQGGDTSEFKSVLLSILNDVYIPFLPTTISVKDSDQRNNYLQCVSAFDILSLIGKNPKFAES